MKRSWERILTTHTGSLPRPRDLALKVVENRDQRKLSADPAFESQVKAAVAEVVHKQAQAGIDILNDGEVSKTGFAAYITERVTGFDGPPRPMPPLFEASLFPEFYASANLHFTENSCNGPITWRGDDYVKRDIADLKAAVQGMAPAELFMSAVSPGQIWFNFPNDYYSSEEAYVFAVADAMKHEYRAIVGAGFVLQLDGPELGMSWGRPQFTGKTFNDYRKFVAMHVEAINHALDGIPADRVRLHLCWGNSERPHVHDVPVVEIIDEVYRANVGALVVEGANPRHGHEWKVFKDHPLPDGKIIIPGVIDTQTNFVEHPELVAERIQRYTNIVGRENVIAGTDCGFSTNVRAQPRVHPTVAWAKLQALAEGAKLASRQLWG